jgi:hypothetical protein
MPTVILTQRVSREGRGISKCIETIPEILQRKDTCVKVDQSGKPVMYGVCTPGSTITPPHLDSSGSGHFIFLLYGMKVVIRRESDPELLESYGNTHCQRKGQLSLNAVKTWRGLKWSVLSEPGHYVQIDPAQVHLVLSPVNSAVTGWSFVVPEWLESGKLELLTDWEINLVKKRNK